MRFESWDALGLDYARGVALTLVAAAGVFALVFAVGTRLLGPVAVLLGAMTAGAAAYIVASAPKRVTDRAAFLQAMEAPSLAASANIYLQSTGSRSRTLLLMRGEETFLKGALREARRMTLLGVDSARIEWAAHRIVSHSVAAVLASVSRIDKARAEEGSEELEGMLSAAELNQETKMPLFIAVAFFLPIMLMLFAAVTHNTGPLALGALAVLELVILDISLSVSSTSEAWKQP